MILLILCIFLGLGSPGLALAQAETIPELHFSTAEWAYEVRGEGDFDPNPSGQFQRSERGYVYLVVEGFELGQQDGFYFLKLNIDVALETIKGFRLFSQTDVLELEEWYLEPPDSTWFYIYVDVPWWAPTGEYQAIITVRDEIGESSLEEAAKITVH